MIRTNFKSHEAAKTELATNDYWPVHGAPGTVQKWRKNRTTYAVGRERKARSTRWHLVKIPASGH